MDLNLLDGIIDMTDTEDKEYVGTKLNEGQQTWLNQVLEKQTWEILKVISVVQSILFNGTCLY